MIIFGSEAKALLIHPLVSKELSLPALARYLVYEYVPVPWSIYRDIYKLPPGHYLVFSNGQAVLTRYWDLLWRRSIVADEEEGCAELLYHLKEAVRRRLVADVPLGVFLSGGVDSSAVVALMAEVAPSKGIDTFSIGMEEKSFDESRHARRVAEWFGTTHHEEVFNLEVLLNLLPEIAASMDEPLADPSLLPTYLLSRFARRHVKVALSGDGGDELFCGYPTFRAFRLAEIYERVPRALRTAVEHLAEALPVSTANFSFDFKVKRFLKGIPYPPVLRNQVWIGAFTPEELKALCVGDLGNQVRREDPYRDVLDMSRAHLDGSMLDILTYQFFKGYLGEGILTKVDRASMACSLEVRSPFLDHVLVEYVLSLPSKFRLKGLNSKYILKRALRGRLPRATLKRPKKGFGIPVAMWLKNDLRLLAEELFQEERIRQDGLFDPGYIRRLLDEHWRGVRDHRKPLWTLLIFQLWQRYFGHANSNR